MSDPTDEPPQPTTDESAELTHTDDSGTARMVDVGDKPDSDRRAVAKGSIYLQPSTIEAIEANNVAKGDVLATARVGAVQAVKHTWESIPLCHQIPITNIDTEFSVENNRIQLTVAVETTGKTGCEMEALEGVTTGLNVILDMCKAAEKDDHGRYPDTRIGDISIITKEKQLV